MGPLFVDNTPVPKEEKGQARPGGGGAVSRIFFQKSQKNWQKSKTYQKLLKMSENFQIL